VAGQAEVLVAGGGLAGLTAALLLRHHGVDVTLVEKRPATSPQPKARRFHMRSMEIFRELGLAGLVHEAARWLAGHDHMAAGRTLAEARQLPLFQPPAGADGPVEVSPELPCLIAQDTLEPVLRRAAEQAGAIVRFGTELLGFGQDETGVTAALTGGESLRARYLVAADGAHSPVRAALGITRSGPGFTGGPMVSVYFRADLGAVVRGREFNLCQIEHPDAPGGLASVDGRLRWVFMSPGAAQGRDWPRDWPSVLRTALGVTAPDLEVLSVLPWRSEMRVADRYRDGRVFLAGDAAHVMPPFGAGDRVPAGGAGRDPGAAPVAGRGAPAFHDRPGRAGLGRAPGAGRPGVPAGRSVPAAAARPHRGLARLEQRGRRRSPRGPAYGAAGIGVTSEAPCPSRWGDGYEGERGGRGGRAREGRVERSGGVAAGRVARASRARRTAVSSWGSRPLAQSSGVMNTSTSGSTP
jgi:2-polyprenyl-6-methoxyphenol hydroxylase-like FAD-dependent oxidoreductase